MSTRQHIYHAAYNHTATEDCCWSTQAVLNMVELILRHMLGISRLWCCCKHLAQGACHASWGDAAWSAIALLVQCGIWFAYEDRVTMRSWLFVLTYLVRCINCDAYCLISSNTLRFLRATTGPAVIMWCTFQSSHTNISIPWRLYITCSTSDWVGAHCLPSYI